MSTSPVMRLLADGIPLSLICDLVSTLEPDSIAINSVERPSGDPIWHDAVSDVVVAWRQAAGD
ncbi:MAG TPA: hypothetical protein VG899_13905 [Mycobacteriales bacterium]|nr:hypothetical protein [Mycobacteriales bacterium]